MSKSSRETEYTPSRREKSESEKEESSEDLPRGTRLIGRRVPDDQRTIISSRQDPRTPPKPREEDSDAIQKALSRQPLHTRLSRDHDRILRQPPAPHVASRVDIPHTVLTLTREYQPELASVEEGREFVEALIELQHIIDEIKGEPRTDIQILGIEKHSPLTAQVSLLSLKEAVETVQDLVVPWRRSHAKEMAFLHEQEKRQQIRERSASASKHRAESKKTEAEAEEIRLRNEQTRWRHSRDRAELALQIIDSYRTDLPPDKKEFYRDRILKLLGSLALPYSIEALAQDASGQHTPALKTPSQPIPEAVQSQGPPS